MIPQPTKQIRIPAIDIVEQVVGETILVTARCGSRHSVSRYVPGVDLLHSKESALLLTELALVNKLALRILKESV